MKKNIFTLLFLLLACSVFSQYRFKHIGIAQGLSQSSVHCVFKDSEGLMWFGTQDGLNRFDGYSFKIFRHDKNDSTTISDDFVLEIIEDKANNLWIGTRNGLNRFDKKTETFTRIFTEGMDKKFYHNVVNSFFKDETGNLVFQTPDEIGFVLVDTVSGKFQMKSQKQPFGVRTGICYDKKGNLFFVDSLNILFSEYKNNSYSPPQSWSKLDFTISWLYYSSKNQLWVFQPSKLLVINGNKEIEQIVSLPVETIRSITEDRAGNYCLGSENGIIILNSSLKIIAHLKNISGDETSLGDNSVINIYEDKEGLIWVGLSDKGVSVFNPQQQVFKTFKKTNDNKNSLSDNSIWAIFQDENKLWIGTKSGLNIFTLKSEKFSAYNSVEENIVSKQIFQNEIIASNIKAITKDKEGNFWIGGSKGIAVLDENGKMLKKFTTENSKLCSNSIFHLLQAKDESIWISTPSGLNHYFPQTNNFEVFTKLDSEKNSLPVNYIISTYEDKNGMLWVCTSGGLSVLNLHTKIFNNYFSEYNNKNSLSYNIVTSGLEDAKGRIWISTLGGGINLFDREKETFTNYSLNDGLANNVVYGIVEDEKGILWMSSNSGISSFNPDTKTFHNYNTNDGIVSNEFSQNSFSKNKNGEIFFGSPEGLLMFNPNQIVEQKNLPNIILTGVSVNYNKIIPYEIEKNKSVELFYKDKTISLEFAELDFINAEKISYSYMLDGFDKKWVEVNFGQRIATYTNLPFGKFIFKVRSKKDNNEWSQPALNVTVNVIPPFWMRWWFVTAIVVFVLVILIFVVKFFAQRKLRKKLREIELQRKIQNERERISRDLHDNVGSHLTYIVTSLDNISHKMEKGESRNSGTEEKISSLSDFSRETIQQLRESIWAINKESILLSEFKDKVNEHFLKMPSLAEQINFSVELQSERNSELKPSIAIHLFRIVQEAVNNCLKHSEAKNIFVKISESPEKNLTIKIADDGKGVEQNKNTNGHYGLENMKMRMKEIGGEFALHSDERRGTEVIISVSL